MILTTEQKRRITDAGGWYSENSEQPYNWECTVWLPGNVTIEQLHDVFRVRHYVQIDGSWAHHLYPSGDHALGLALVVSRDLAGDTAPPLDRNADRAGNAVARAMRDLADLARRADNARKARRNG